MKDVQVGLQKIITWTKILMKGRWVAEAMHWWWDATPKAKNSYQNKICQQSDHIWGEVGIQASHEVVSWKVYNTHFITNNS